MSTPPQLPGAARDLFLHVQAATQGTPYIAIPTSQGFDVRLNVADAHWFGLISVSGIRTVSIHHVAVVAPGAYTIEDDLHTIEWSAGVAGLSANGSRVRGRTISFTSDTAWAFDSQGRFGRQLDYTFSPAEGRSLITTVAQSLGMRSRAGGAERIGLIAAGAGVLIAVLAGVLAIVVTR